MLIKTIIDRFEGDKVVLRTSDKEDIIFPKNKLPNNIKEGLAIRIAVSLDGENGEADKELARDILNEILDSSQKE